MTKLIVCTLLAVSAASCVISEPEAPEESQAANQLSSAVVPPPPIDPGDFIIDGPEGFQAAYLWTGFRHAWSRSGHRLGDITNAIRDEFHELADPQRWLANAKAHLQFTVGNEGDSAHPEIKLDFIRAPGLRIARTSRTFPFNDHATCVGGGWFDGPKRCFASAGSSQPLVINLDTQRLAHGTLDKYVVVLRGFAITNIQCDDDDDCPNSLWPTSLNIEIEDCIKQQTTLTCPSIVSLARANSPDSNSVLGKEFNIDMSYDFTVDYTVIGGNAGAFAARSAHLHTDTRDIHDPIPVTSHLVTGTPGFQSVALALRHLRWNINDHVNPLTSDFFARGRYIKEYRFDVKPLAYNAETGSLTYSYAAGIRTPDPLVHQALVDFEIEAAMLQFDSDSFGFISSIAAGEVCNDHLYNCGFIPVQNTSIVTLAFNLFAP